jgi:transposase
MSKTYRPWNPDQQWLLPPSPRQWLPEGDMVYFLMDVVRDLDLSPIACVYERSEQGYPPFHPRMMTCLLIYSYCMGVRSSRQIAHRCERDSAWRVIVGSDIPDFRTINLFRKTHLAAFSELFLQVLQVCREAGLVKLGHVSLDGTKIKANASRHKAMSYGRMKEEEERLKREIAELTAQAESEDVAEDARHGRDARGDELPRELARRESRLQRIQQAKEALEERARMEAERVAAEKAKESEEPPPGGASAVASPVKVEDKAQYNFTDPQSRIMKANNKGWDQCGNAQAVVDSGHQIIVAADVTAQANDSRQVEPMLSQAQQNVGQEARIQKASMDAGYFSEANVQWLEQERIDGYVATGRLKHGERVAAAGRGRIPKGLSCKERMARKLRTLKGRVIYARRKAIVEPVFGQIKRVMGFTQFLLRGLEQMRGEWRLVCLSHNLRKLFRAKSVVLG